MLKLYGKKDKKLTVDLSTVNKLKENDKILIASNGKMKQIDQNLVNIGGGGNTPDGPTFNDGKTRLFVTIPDLERPDITILIGCTVAGGVTIDWGDGSETEITTSTERTTYSHSYSATGDYIISLEVTDGDLVLEGNTKDQTGIGGAARYNNIRIRKVEIGDSVTSIGDYAFSGCSALSSVVIQEGVTSIGNGAFGSCYTLTSVVIPSSVTSIGNGAFGSCYALTSVVIQEGVTSIGDSAFGGCSALSSVVIPSSVTSFGNSAFGGCSALSSVVIQEGVTSIGNGAFSGCSALSSVVIQEGVTSIGNSAFGGCSALSSVVIPSSVTSVNDSAFGNCSSLGGVHLLSPTPPTLSSSGFSNIPSDCKFYIPAGSLEAYSTATNWSNYASMMVEE